jgi:mono/diheme cytochrome c family protein
MAALLGRRSSKAALGKAGWVVVAGALLACEPSDPTPVGRGRGIFQRTCSGCHGRDGRGTLRPGLSRPPRDLTNPEFQAQMSDEQLRQSIRIGKGQMPAFGGLMGDEEISNVIASVRSLVPPGTSFPGSGGRPGVAPPATSAPEASPPAPGAASPAGAAVPGAAGAEPAAITARGANAP